MRRDHCEARKLIRADPIGQQLHFNESMLSMRVNEPQVGHRWPGSAQNFNCSSVLLQTSKLSTE
jgi:hypothetical protein